MVLETHAKDSLDCRLCPENERVCDEADGFETNAAMQSYKPEDVLLRSRCVRSG